MEEPNITSQTLLLKIYNLSYVAGRLTQIERRSTNNWDAVFKSVKGLDVAESLGNYSMLKETSNTEN